jgi:hypothetical protein
LLASEPLTPRVALASVAILGAIVLIRKGERTTERRVVSRASDKAASLSECA